MTLTQKQRHQREGISYAAGSEFVLNPDRDYIGSSSMWKPQLSSKSFYSIVLSLSVACISPAFAQAPPQTEVQEQVEAKAILMRMAEFLAHLPRFSVTARMGYDVVQQNGQKIEFGEVREVVAARPDRMRVDVKRSDGDQELLLFDGSSVTVFDADNNVYARIDKPGDLDALVTYFVKDLQMRLPLAQMLVTSLPAQLQKRVRSVDYVERAVDLDVPCDHLAARADTVDFQVWIAQGDQPLPRRVVITYREAEGEPQFWAELANWNLAPETPEALFAFTPPAGAEEIPIIVAVGGGQRQPGGGTK